MHLTRSLAALLVLLPVGSIAAWTPPTRPGQIEMCRDARRELAESRRDMSVGIMRSLVIEDGATIRCEDHLKAARLAVSAWGKALTDSPFEIGRSARRSVITIRFVSAIGDGDDVQGMVDVHRHGDGRVSAEITIRDNADGAVLTDAQLSSVIGHELGHVLGLDDSEDRLGLMGEFYPESPILAPTSAEAAQVTAFRADVRRSIADLRG